MRTRQIPISLPDSIRDWYQQQADKLCIPLAAYLRMKLVEVQISATRENATAVPAARPQPTSNDEPDLMNVW